VSGFSLDFLEMFLSFSSSFLMRLIADLLRDRMLAVMTMNVGYFLSILGGTFLGSFVIGDWDPSGEHCDGH
jgi:hypothetical protein